MAMLLLPCFSACESEKENGYEPYDPGKAITLTSFYPDSGGVATKVILNGENFGTDAKNIKVFFNDKEAAVIEAIGNKIYAICPRKPGEGDENNIVKCRVRVQVGDKSVEYPDPFRPWSPPCVASWALPTMWSPATWRRPRCPM